MKQRPLIMVMLIYSLFIGCIGMKNQVIIEDNKIKSKGLYEVDALDGEWKWYTVKLRGRNLNFTTQHDIIYTGCPADQHGISIQQTTYNWPLGKKPRSILGKERSTFETIVMDFFDEFYDAIGPKISKRELLSFQKIKLVDYEAVEAIFLTEEKYSKSCVTTEKSIRSIKSKFIVIKRGEWAESYAWFGVQSPNLIVFWYQSPVETFDEGVGEFDKMVQSFRFIKE